MKRLVDAQGRRFTWLALQTGYDPSYISRLLHGKVPVTDEAANRIARALQVPVTYFESASTESAVA